jgi:hypothetical protein
MTDMPKISNSNRRANANILEELARLESELAKANKTIALHEEAGTTLLVKLTPLFLHASALTEVCECMYQLLLTTDAEIPQGWLKAIKKTHELYELNALKAVVGLVDIMRQGVSEHQKVSEAEMLQKAIKAFCTPNDVSDQITAHMAGKIREVVSLVEAGARTKQAKAGAAGRVSKNPVSAVKPKVFAFWKEREDGLHPKLRTNEKFAMECMRRWPELNSIKVITGWCTQWSKDKKNHFAG